MRRAPQLLQQTRRPLAAKAGSVVKEDYEYKRAGTRNSLPSPWSPKEGIGKWRSTARRTKVDFVKFVARLVETVYAKAQKIHPGC